MNPSTVGTDRTADRERTGSRYTRRYADDRYARNGGVAYQEQEALTSLLSQYLDAIRASVRSRAELFSLEAQRATDAASRMATLAGVLLIAGITGWLLLVTTIVLGMAAAGVPLLAALLSVFAVHLIAVFVTLGRMRRLAADFQFSATRRSLREGFVKLRPSEAVRNGAGPVAVSATVAGTPGDVAASRVAPAGVAPTGVAPTGVAPAGVAPVGATPAGVTPAGGMPAAEAASAPQRAAATARSETAADRDVARSPGEVRAGSAQEGPHG